MQIDLWMISLFFAKHKNITNLQASSEQNLISLINFHLIVMFKDSLNFLPRL